jgi:hypothetical protein
MERLGLLRPAEVEAQAGDDIIADAADRLPKPQRSPWAGHRQCRRSSPFPQGILQRPANATAPWNKPTDGTCPTDVRLLEAIVGSNVTINLIVRDVRNDQGAEFLERRLIFRIGRQLGGHFIVSLNAGGFPNP